MAQTVTVVVTVPTPAATGFFVQADVEAKTLAYVQELTNALGPQFHSGNPLVLTSITMS